MRNKFYITTSIAYTNAPPHIGFALELVQADVLARHNRLLGKDVFFLTGVDEHGQKVAKAAKTAGKTPQEFVDEISGKYRSLASDLNISNDDFIRTTDKKRHWPAVERIWKALEKNGDIYKKRYKGLYCEGCEAFVKEKDLIEGKCCIHLKAPETIEEENYFFKLSKYAGLIEKVIKKDEIDIIPKTRKNEILSFISHGIEDVSCSRSRENLEWGIPVPGDDSQIVYIWFEALINYLFPEKYWPADVHCVGKDIFRFHSLLWPAIILAAKKPLFKKILVHGFITSAGRKMSKSLGNVVDPFELIEKYGADSVRYFLLREIPSTEDGDFTYEKFGARYNSDLASGIGNLVARVITMAKNSNIQKPPQKITNPKLRVKIKKTEKDCKKSLENFKFNDALAVIWDLISSCDKYIEEEKPWEKSNDQKEVIGNLLLSVCDIAKILEPFLPETSEKILKQVKIGKSSPLFPRIQ